MIWSIILSAFSSALAGTIVGPIIKRILDSRFDTASRKEATRDADAEFICSVIDGLMDDCTRFWGESAEDLESDHPKLIAQIRAKLHNLNEMQNHLFVNYQNELKNTRDEWKELHRAATGGNFDDTDRLADAGKLTVILQTGWGMRRGVRLRRQAMKRSVISG